MSNKKAAKSSKSRRDTAVQCTNNSSIVSKLSAATCGYFSDDYLKYFAGDFSRRSPLINRGYYIRFRAVDQVLQNFIFTYSEQSFQILSLGAGYDSTFFRLKAEGLLSKAVYIEIDFKDLMLKKLRCIQNCAELSALLSSGSTSTLLASNICESIVYNSEDYKMLGIDLTNISLLSNILSQAGVSSDKPTLLLSEVVICYITPDKTCELISWAARHFLCSVFVLYEQILPFDDFGRFMCQHFNKLGSPLRSVETYSTLQSQIYRFLDLGFSRVLGSDLNLFYTNILSEEEKERVSKLEPFDEMEEWHLKCSHYILLTAFNGPASNTDSLVNSIWNTKENYDINTSLCLDSKYCIPNLVCKNSLRRNNDANCGVLKSVEKDCRTSSETIKTLNCEETENKGQTINCQECLINGPDAESKVKEIENIELELEKQIAPTEIIKCDHITSESLTERTGIVSTDWYKPEVEYLFARMGHSTDSVDFGCGKWLVVVGGFGLNREGKHKRLGDVILYRVDGQDNSLGRLRSADSLYEKGSDGKMVNQSSDSIVENTTDEKLNKTQHRERINNVAAEPETNIPAINEDSFANVNSSVGICVIKTIASDGICKTTSLELTIGDNIDYIEIPANIERLHHSVVNMGNNRIVLCGGRKSPMCAFNDIIIMEFTLGDTKDCKLTDSQTMKATVDGVVESNKGVIKADSKVVKLDKGVVNVNLVQSSEDTKNKFMKNPSTLAPLFLSSSSLCNWPSPRWRHAATFVPKRDWNSGAAGIKQDQGAVEERQRIGERKGEKNTGGPGGVIFILGGRNESGMCEDSCWKLNCDTWTWNQIKSEEIKMHCRRHSLTSDFWKLSNKLVISCGLARLDDSPIGGISLLDLSTLQITELATSHQIKPRYSHTSAIVKDSILLLVGGVSITGSLPVITGINLLSGTVQEFCMKQNSSRERSITMLFNHSMIVLHENVDSADESDRDNAELFILGGGGNCFSFGTHLNRNPLQLSVPLKQLL